MQYRVLTDETTRSMNWGSGIDHVGGRSKELISDSNDGGSESRRSEIYKERERQMLMSLHLKWPNVESNVCSYRYIDPKERSSIDQIRGIRRQPSLSLKYF